MWPGVPTVLRVVHLLPPLEVDPVRNDGVGVEVKVDGVVVTSLEETFVMEYESS